MYYTKVKRNVNSDMVWQLQTNINRQNVELHQNQYILGQLQMQSCSIGAFNKGLPEALISCLPTTPCLKKVLGQYLEDGGRQMAEEGMNWANPLLAVFL